MTPQEIFDKAADLMRSGKTVRHRYRTTDGCRCVVGHFMPDDVLDKIDTLEANADFLTDVTAKLGKDMPAEIRDNLELFRSLQFHNDDESLMLTTEERLKQIAKHYNLTLKEPA